MSFFLLVISLFFICLLIFVIVIVAVIYLLLSDVFEKDEETEPRTSKTKTSREESVPAEINEVDSENEYEVTENELSKFDISFLKFENEEKNKNVYTYKSDIINKASGGLKTSGVN